jgi:hypothetical protein
MRTGGGKQLRDAETWTAAPWKLIRQSASGAGDAMPSSAGGSALRENLHSVS